MVESSISVSFQLPIFQIDLINSFKLNPPNHPNLQLVNPLPFRKLSLSFHAHTTLKALTSSDGRQGLDVGAWSDELIHYILQCQGLEKKFMVPKCPLKNWKNWQ